MPHKAPYGYVKDPDNKDILIIDEEAAEVVRLIFRLFLEWKNRNQIAVYLTQAQIPTPTFYMKDRGRGTCKNKVLNEDNRYKWNKVTLTHIRTHNTALKKRLLAYSRRYPAICQQTDADPETGCMEFDIEKGRFSFRLTAPYSEERRDAAR